MHSSPQAPTRSPKSNSSGLDDLLTAHSVPALFTLLILFAVLTVGSLWAYFHVFNGALSNDKDAWGAFGSYISGAITAVLGPVTVFALLVSQASQRKQMREAEEDRKAAAEERKKAEEARERQRKASALQAFEQTFFSWLGTYRDLLGEITIGTGENLDTGRKALLGRWISYFRGDRVWGHLRKAPEYARCGKTEYIPFDISEQSIKEAIARTVPRPNDTMGAPRCLLVLELPHRQVASNLTIWLWSQLYDNHKYQFDNLFRGLYRLLLWIDSQDLDNLTVAQKWFYVSIVRSQLSWIELVYLFVNGYSRQGEKFRYLADKYALFDNLTTEDDPALENLKWVPPHGATHYSTAFDSVQARLKLGLPATSEESLKQALEVE